MVKLNLVLMTFLLGFSVSSFANSMTPEAQFYQNCIQSPWIGDGFRNKELFDKEVKPQHCGCVAKKSVEEILKFGNKHKQQMFQDGIKYLSEPLAIPPFIIDQHGTIELINQAQIACVENGDYQEAWSQFLRE